MKKHILVFSALVALLLPAAAQPLRGSYFLENALLRSRLNPAFAPQDNYISVPIAGYAGAEVLSNVGLGHFLFPSGDTTCTFMNDAVRADSFLNQLPEEDPYAKFRIETDLLGGGYRLNDRLYLSAGLSVVQTGEARIAKELLRFAKTGRSGAQQSWSIPDSELELSRFVTLSAAASYDLGRWIPGLQVGGRLKLMTGLKAASGSLNSARIQMNDDLFAVDARGDAFLAGYTYDPEEGFQSDRFGLRGFGAAVDAGAEYRIRFNSFVSSLHLSASVSNLGGLSFGQSDRLSAGGSTRFSGFGDMGAEGFDFQESLQTVLDDFSSLADFRQAGSERFPFALSPEYFAGLEVTVLQEMLGAGLLYNRAAGFDNLTVSLNAAPLRWLDFSIGYTFLGAADRLGFYADCTPWRHLNLFFGFEKAAWKTNNRMLGIKNLTESAVFGLNVLL